MSNIGDLGQFAEKRLDIFRMPSRKLAKWLESELDGYGYHPVHLEGSFVYARGDIPVMLVAHMDTVFEAFKSGYYRYGLYNNGVYCGQITRSTKKSSRFDCWYKIEIEEREEISKDIFWDRQQNILWSPNGLGADDRAGVLGILAILEAGYRPHILFTDGEESGGYGADDATFILEPVPDVNYIVEIDRAGNMEAVFYSNANKEFKKYIKSFGFVEESGSFTDISILCPAWSISGVNLSAGYRNAHRETEYLNLNHLRNTLVAVCKMLSAPVRRRFEYKEAKKVVRKLSAYKIPWHVSRCINGLFVRRASGARYKKFYLKDVMPIDKIDEYATM